MTDQPARSLALLPSTLAAGVGERPFVAIAATARELQRWLANPLPDLQWVQVEGLLADVEAWAAAAQGKSEVPLDVVLAAPGAEFASLYRLVDVRGAREVRVTMPAAPGFLKALRLAASLGMPVRLLPGQPSLAVLAELAEALAFYLHDPMVETPIEPFHSLFAAMHGAETGTLWMSLEEDPAVFVRYGDDGQPRFPRSSDRAPDESALATFVERHLAGLIAEDAECAECPWQQECAGYFKWPDRAYSCTGVRELFATIAAAADDIGQTLAMHEA